MEVRRCEIKQKNIICPPKYKWGMDWERSKGNNTLLNCQNYYKVYWNNANKTREIFVWLKTLNNEFEEDIR